MEQIGKSVDWEKVPQIGKATLKNVKEQKPWRIIAIKDTPFHAVERKADEWVIILGNNLASEKTFKTLKEANDYTTLKPWDLVMTIAWAITTTTIENKK